MDNITHQNVTEIEPGSNGISNVCRLCSAEENLIDLFQPQNPVRNFFRSVILYGTGLEIKEDDMVSKMVCQRCCEIAVKLHKYRSNALSNDKLLKSQYGIPQQQSTNGPIESVGLSNGLNKSDDLSHFPLENIVSENTNGGFEQNVDKREPTNVQKDDPPKPKLVPRIIVKHPSVQKLYKLYPNLKIPSKIFADHVWPVISLDESEVSNWYDMQVQKIKHKLSHITIKKISSTDHASSNVKICNGYSNDITLPPTPDSLDRCPNSLTTSNNVSPSTKVENKCILQKASSSSSSFKAKPTARKSTTTIQVNLPPDLLPISNRRFSISSAWSFDDNFDDHFDDALSVSNMSTHSMDSGDNQGKPISLSELNEPSNSKPDLLDNKPTNLFKSLEKLKTVKTTENQKEIVKNSLFIKDEDKVNLVERVNTNKAVVAGKRDGLESTQKHVPIIQRARKRTAKHEDFPIAQKLTKSDKIASIGQKPTRSDKMVKRRNKRYFNKDMVTDFKELDSMDPSGSVSRTMDGDTTSTVSTVPGKSTLEADSLFVLTTGKTLPVFICAVCSLVCDTKRQLVDHEKKHLTCKFCKVKIKNWQLLIEHLNDTCIINVRNDDARVQLVRVDDDPLFLQKYKQALQAELVPEDEDDTLNDDMFDHDDYVGEIKEEECEDSFIKQEEVKIEDDIENNDENDGNIICLSDNDEGHGADFSIIQRHTIIPEEEEEILIDDELKIINRTDRNDIYVFDAMQRHHSSEAEMIKTLFKKYYHGLIKFDKRCQTFRSTNRCVRRTSNNLILLERMLSELSVYIVSVAVESRPNITARFSTPQTPVARNLDYWGYKKTTCIVKPAVKAKPCSTSTAVESKLHAKRPPTVETKHLLEQKVTPSIANKQTKPLLLPSNSSSSQEAVNASSTDVSSPAPFQQVFITSRIPPNELDNNENLSSGTNALSTETTTIQPSNSSTSGTQTNVLISNVTNLDNIVVVNILPPASEATIQLPQDTNAVTATSANDTNS